MIFLKAQLESKFSDDMSWNNYGRKKGIKCWEIDHIKPCCKFDLTDPEQQHQCFHWTNLQPLWALDNSSKGGRYVEPQLSIEFHTSTSVSWWIQI